MDEQVKFLTMSTFNCNCYLEMAELRPTTGINITGITYQVNKVILDYLLLFRIIFTIMKLLPNLEKVLILNWKGW